MKVKAKQKKIKREEKLYWFSETGLVIVAFVFLCLAVSVATLMYFQGYSEGITDANEEILPYVTHLSQTYLNSIDKILGLHGMSPERYREILEECKELIGD